VVIRAGLTVPAR